MKVETKHKRTNEKAIHNWFYTEEGWIRLTDSALTRAKEGAAENMEDCPKISVIKQFLLNLLLK